MAADPKRAERLRLARAKAGYDSAAEAARALGMKSAAYSHHDNGTRGFLDHAPLYASLFNHSLEKYPLWPFDLASWLSARDRDWLHLLRHAPSMVSVPHPISTTVVGHQVRVDLAAGVAFAHVEAPLIGAPANVPSRGRPKQARFKSHWERRASQ